MNLATMRMQAANNRTLCKRNGTIALVPPLDVLDMLKALELHTQPQEAPSHTIATLLTSLSRTARFQVRAHRLHTKCITVHGESRCARVCARAGAA